MSGLQFEPELSLESECEKAVVVLLGEEESPEAVLLSCSLIYCVIVVSTKRDYFQSSSVSRNVLFRARNCTEPLGTG
jgi:hypothetical protein